MQLVFAALLSTTTTRRLAIGIDVGTGSARAGIVDVTSGALLATHKRDIKTWSPKPDYFEQSSEDVWAACAECVRNVLAMAGASASDVIGIGFDATCSLVCVDSENKPVGVDPDLRRADERNIILWADHRANDIAAAINAKGHARLATVGGAISPEMEVPKMLWLKQHLPDAFARVISGGKFLDLPDYLTYRATDCTDDVRSLCTVVCKWNYDANGEGTGVGFDRNFLGSVGFADNELSDYTIGARVAAPGEPVAGGLGPKAAADFGLLAGTALAVGMIDAHAGGIGCLGAKLNGAGSPSPSSPLAEASPLSSRLALIAGTSTCHMASSSAPCFVPGVWGPYWSAMVPGLYLNEGGQSAAGSLLDHFVHTHAAYSELEELARARGVPPTIALNERLKEMASAAGTSVAALARDVHVTPDALGNRSPLADPLMRAAVVGLGLSATLDDLAFLYLAAVQALAYQTRHIIEAMEEAGHPPITSVIACGGLSKNVLYVSTHADVLGRTIYLPVQDEAVLLGAAILGTVAAGAHPSIAVAMERMSAVGTTVRPGGGEGGGDIELHERKYRVFRKMTEDQRAYRNIMAGG